MTEQENVQLIQEFYAAFGRGDVPAILDQLTDDVVWYDPGPPEVPHAGSYSGREGVGRFFARTDETLEIDEFVPTEFLAQGDRVVVLGSLHARVKETGRSYDNEYGLDAA
jgi:ketosteroid isomerase-like protein